MTAAEFWERYRKLFVSALTSGVRYRLHSELPGPHNELSPKQVRRFRADCHRGYDRAQRYALELLEELGQVEGENEDVLAERALHVRKVMDAIAFCMFGMSTHPLRRMGYLDTAPPVQLEVLRNTVVEASKRNARSRQTFSLVTDLTTALHVGDLVTIDFRPGRPTVRLEELKSGKVNEMLLERLGDYEPTRESLGKIQEDEAIEAPFKKQARRMLHQQIRMHDVEQVLATDEGTDLALERPLKIPHEWAEEENYDGFLERALDVAREGGFGGGTVDWSIHLGAGFGSTPEEARRRAGLVVKRVIGDFYHDLPGPVSEVASKWDSKISMAERLRATSLVSSNLYNPSSRPFPAWSISMENREALVTGHLSVLSVLDVFGLVAVARRAGVPMEFSSRKRAAQVRNDVGRKAPTWSDRVLTYTLGKGEVTVLSGMLSRFVNDLASPAKFFREVTRLST